MLYEIYYTDALPKKVRNSYNKEAADVIDSDDYLTRRIKTELINYLKKEGIRFEIVELHTADTEFTFSNFSLSFDRVGVSAHIPLHVFKEGEKAIEEMILVDTFLAKNDFVGFDLQANCDYSEAFNFEDAADIWINADEDANDMGGQSLEEGKYPKVSAAIGLLLVLCLLVGLATILKWIFKVASSLF